MQSVPWAHRTLIWAWSSWRNCFPQTVPYNCSRPTAWIRHSVSTLYTGVWLAQCAHHTHVIEILNLSFSSGHELGHGLRAPGSGQEHTATWRNILNFINRRVAKAFTPSWTFSTHLMVINFKSSWLTLDRNLESVVLPRPFCLSPAVKDRPLEDQFQETPKTEVKPCLLTKIWRRQCECIMQHCRRDHGETCGLTVLLHLIC